MESRWSTSASCCLFKPPLRSRSTKLPNRGQLGGPGMELRLCGQTPAAAATGASLCSSTQAEDVGLLCCRPVISCCPSRRAMRGAVRMWTLMVSRASSSSARVLFSGQHPDPIYTRTRVYHGLTRGPIRSGVRRMWRSSPPRVWIHCALLEGSHDPTARGGSALSTPTNLHTPPTRPPRPSSDSDALRSVQTPQTAPRSSAAQIFTK